MPFINTKLSIPLNEEKEILLKEKFGKAISLIGKSENWLMLSFEDNCRLHFHGESNIPLAFVEVMLYGSAQKSAYDKLTAELSDILEKELEIPKSNIYIKYEEVDVWGFNGDNL